MLNKQNNIIKKYINCVNSRLDILFKNDIIDKEACEKELKNYLNRINNFIAKDTIFTIYKIKFITEKDILNTKCTKEYTINYERIVEKKVEDITSSYKIIYTTADNKDLKDFDYSKIYLIYNEKIMPDESYTYLIKEYTIYIYINDKYFDYINTNSINIQIA